MEERRKQAPQPRNEMERELNDDQLIAMRNYENFGWKLQFVRRPLFAEAIPVMYDPDTGRHAILEPDGSLNEDHDLDLRD